MLQPVRHVLYIRRVTVLPRTSILFTAAPDCEFKSLLTWALCFWMPFSSYPPTPIPGFIQLTITRVIQHCESQGREPRWALWCTVLLLLFRPLLSTALPQYTSKKPIVVPRDKDGPFGLQTVSRGATTISSISPSREPTFQPTQTHSAQPKDLCYSNLIGRGTHTHTDTHTYLGPVLLNVNVLKETTHSLSLLFTFNVWLF